MKIITYAVLVSVAIAAAMSCVLFIPLPKRPAPLPQKSADRLCLEIMAMSLNEAQTNWTVIVVPRTNAP